MADRGHADADQVLSRKLRQHLGVNIAFSESGRVSLETQAPQPRRYVHQAPPSSSSSALASLRSSVSKPSVNQP